MISHSESDKSGATIHPAGINSDQSTRVLKGALNHRSLEVREYARDLPQPRIHLSGQAGRHEEVGRELGVRYVLGGSVRHSGDQVRVNAHLIDTATDVHLRADRIDAETNERFALQDEITGRLANALGIELIATEAARSVERSDVLDYLLRG